MTQRQLNVILKRIFKIDNMKEAVNETVIQKINLNDEYHIIDSKTKLQKTIDVTSNKTKLINFRIGKFRRSSISHSNSIKEMFRSNLKYD